jgi:SNW domain-containing protein 1
MRRKLRMNNMGTEARVRAMAREQNRDISEKIALGLAKPTTTMDYDARLFNQSGGLDSGLNEESSMFDRPLFAAQQAAQSIYRPRGVDVEVDGDEVYDGLSKNSRFEVLGRAQKGFKGAGDAPADRTGPVQFEKDKDVFGIDAFLGDVKKQIDGEKGKRKWGLSKDEETYNSTSKRRKSDSEDED